MRTMSASLAPGDLAPGVLSSSQCGAVDGLPPTFRCCFRPGHEPFGHWADVGRSGLMPRLEYGRGRSLTAPYGWANNWDAMADQRPSAEILSHPNAGDKLAVARPTRRDFCSMYVSRCAIRMMMTGHGDFHPSFEDIRNLRLGRLSDRETQSLEKHLLHCAECQKYADALDWLVRATRRAAHAPPGTRPDPKKTAIIRLKILEFKTADEDG